MFRKRRTERKIAQMARLLVALDALAAASRPAPRRVSRVGVR